MTASKRRWWHGPALIFFIVIAPSVSVGQTNGPAPLPPAAQEALNKGILAAKVPDYQLAIRFFEDARKIAPEAPIVFLNLGLAESRVPSRELRAIAWFGAYLAAYPTAPNAAAVKEQIAVLDVKNQSNISQLIKSVENAANQTPNYRSPHLHDVATLWAIAGDFTAALRTADLIRDELGVSVDKSAALSKIAEAQAEAGDLAGALKTVELIPDKKWKSQAQSTIAKAQATAGSASNQPAVPVSGWLFKLDDSDTGYRHCAGSTSNRCPLNTAPFLDLAGYLKSLPTRPIVDLSSVPAELRALQGKQPPPDDSESLFFKLHGVAELIATARNNIHQDLKQQASQ